MYILCLPVLISQVDNQLPMSGTPVVMYPTMLSGDVSVSHPILSLYAERLAHNSPFVIVIKVHTYIHVHVYTYRCGRALRFEFSNTVLKCVVPQFVCVHVYSCITL